MMSLYGVFFMLGAILDKIKLPKLGKLIEARRLQMGQKNLDDRAFYTVDKGIEKKNLYFFRKRRQIRKTQTGIFFKN
jgi:hypothetical protein